MTDLIDVAVIGGGPAGLAAALVLGRCRRRVTVFDSGEYRNEAARAMHGFLSRDGIAPAELRRIAIQQLQPYNTVAIRHARIEHVQPNSAAGFDVLLAGGQIALRCRKLLLATGLVDQLPDVAGIEALYGRSVHHCPYCEGWEVRDEPLAAYGCGDSRGGGLALELKLWSADVILCSDGPCGLGNPYRAQLAEHGIRIEERKIARVVGDDQGLDLVFESGEVLHRSALFFNLGTTPRSDLAQRLGCPMDDRGSVVGVQDSMVCAVPGVYVAGDMTRDVLQAAVAAGEGVSAAVAINKALFAEDLLPVVPDPGT